MTTLEQGQAARVSDLPRVGSDVQERRRGKNYTLVRLGPTSELRQYAVQHPLAQRPGRGKVFLKEPLGLTAMEISFGLIPAGGGVPFIHKHRENEEVYLFIRGKGQLQIDGEVLDVEEGTAVRVSPEGARAWRNTGEEDLFYIVIQAKEGTLTSWTLSDGEEVPGRPEWPN